MHQVIRLATMESLHRPDPRIRGARRAVERIDRHPAVRIDPGIGLHVSDVAIEPDIVRHHVLGEEEVALAAVVDHVTVGISGQEGLVFGVHLAGSRPVPAHLVGTPPRAKAGIWQLWQARARV